jgi:threonine aldolase
MTRQHTNSTMQIIERKCEAQKGVRIRNNLKSNMVSWTVGDKKHSINSPISLEI